METYKEMRINLMLVVIIGCCVALKVSRAITDSCQVSKETVDIVEDCPDSLEKWMEAAARKNCEAYANQCDEPDRLEYHCVINAFINQTLEVCAYKRFIVSGFCAEYNFGGNLIQQNFRTNCFKFTQNPCPSSYPSTDAYKYPGCYEMTKKTTVGPATITTFSTVNATHMNNEEQSNGVSSTVIVIVLILVVLVLVLTVCVYMYIRFWRTKKRKRDSNYSTCVEESPMLIVSRDTETGSRNVAPSGQCIGNGEKTRKIMTVEEEIMPEHFLKPEKDLKQDCQTLLSLLSDGFERLAVISSENCSAENQPNLINLHHEYYSPDLSISQESTQILVKDLAQVESLIDYFEKSKNKQGICKE
ncbi:uncharacterized protein LOC128168997 isoform X2 [Crassostrea angulata]|uniref:uncharacterized protein LOC128168997 isoform X2 n=1 Tax=Magallana angulata TaxID=2784310 RepID=UPI0022B1FCFD|nr:uncharacterized protein LOC128168997 isoform X2 [Crassostrea angulata]